MEIRKVQVTGGSSYVITLPKEWIKSLNIKKNDPLGLMAQPDGTLLITPETTGEKMHRTKEFSVDTIDDPEYLFRLLVGAYIMGYSLIVVKSDKRIPPFVMECVTHFTQTAVGPEIIEETMNSITIKKKDMKAANKNMESIKQLASYCEEISNSALQIKGRSSISLSYIAESIKRTGEYAGDIAELVIDHLVNE